MLHHDSVELRESFFHNLADWCRGGPHPGGWTRGGAAVPVPACHLRRCVHKPISVEDGLAKNRPEVERWHVGFLRNRGVLEETAYYTEYLLPRYGPIGSRVRAANFLALHASVGAGYARQYPVVVADVSGLDLGFKYFRFDGCHRLASAKVCGMAVVPAAVFTVGAGSRA